MNPDWHDFLTRHGATLAAGMVQRFGDSAAELQATEQGTVLCDLSQFGTLRVSGEEAQSFLQNLLSNDIRDVSTTRAQLSSFNTAKGRMLATMLIWREGEDYLLQLPRLLCEPIRKKLGMYVLRAKVKITDAGDEIVTLGLSGANAREILRTQFGELPQQPFGVIGTTQGSVIKISDSRFLVSTPAPNAASLWTALGQRAHTGRQFVLGLAQYSFRHPGDPAANPGTVRRADGKSRTPRRRKFQQGLLSGAGNRCAHAVSRQTQTPHVSGASQWQRRAPGRR